MKSLMFFELLLLISCLSADALYSFLIDSKSPLVRALADNASHGIIAFFSWCVVMVSMPSGATAPSTLEFVSPALVCAFVACLIDVDHFLVADSFSLSAALRLERRPPLHATIPLLSFSIFACILRRYLNREDEDDDDDDENFYRKCVLSSLTVLGPISSIAVMSHHARDAIRRGFFLWPFHSSRHTPPVPRALVYALTLIFPIVVSKLFYFHHASTTGKSLILDV